jgi:CRISPR/Cas system-associated exonuclease Cas4 (RecB family)
MEVDDIKRELGTLSASRIETYLTCPRKFWYKYKRGWREPETDAMRIGTRIHTEAERYYKGETDALTNAELIEARSRGLFPPREATMFVERSMLNWGVHLAGIPVNGEADLIYRDDDGRIVVRDWKTRSGFGYAPDAAELADDLQINLYAYGAGHVCPEADRFVVEHVNLLKAHKGGPETKVVRAELTRDDIASKIEWAAAKVEEMLATFAKDDVTNVEVASESRSGSESCFKYGPCYYLREHGCENDEYDPDRSWT